MGGLSFLGLMGDKGLSFGCLRALLALVVDEIGAGLLVGFSLLALGGMFPKTRYSDLYLKNSQGKWVV